MRFKDTLTEAPPPKPGEKPGDKDGDKDVDISKLTPADKAKLRNEWAKRGLHSKKSKPDTHDFSTPQATEKAKQAAADIMLGDKTR